MTSSLTAWNHADAYGIDNIQGPAHGFISYLKHLGCLPVAEGHAINIQHETTNRKYDFLCGSRAAFQRNIQALAKRQLLQSLCDRISKACDEGKCCRKDMEGITPVLDEHAVWTASQGRSLRKHIKNNPDVVNLSQDPTPHTQAVAELETDDEDSTTNLAKEITEK